MGRKDHHVNFVVLMEFPCTTHMKYLLEIGQIAGLISMAWLGPPQQPCRQPLLPLQPLQPLLAGSQLPSKKPRTSDACRGWGVNFCCHTINGMQRIYCRIYL